MKKLTACLVMSLMSSMAFAEVGEFHYSNYKELALNELQAGSYSFTSTCTDNELSWDKVKKSYTKKISTTESKGYDLIQHGNNSVKITSNSTNSDGEKFFGEVVTTFTSENTYSKVRRNKTIFKDQTEHQYETLVEGTYENGKIAVTKYAVNGVEKEFKKYASVYVVLDAEANNVYDAFTYEPSNVKEDIQNPEIQNVLIKIDTVCKSQSTKL